jgi:phosphoribosyl-ATP pyrophosphohydrolase/phosphoribosyl-AMP cyclohydrolase
MTTPDFQTHELIPAVIQDYTSQEVLMLGYMNEEAWNKTKETGKVTFFSRKRQTLWTKGETSGNFLNVKDTAIDCDQDTILIKAIPDGPVCHKGTATCFNDDNRSSSLKFLEEVITARKNDPANKKSYTRELLSKGPKKVAQKVGEEAVELALEAMDSNNEDFLNEAADLMYHYLVLLQSKGFEMNDVVEVLRERHK